MNAISPVPRYCAQLGLATVVLIATTALLVRTLGVGGEARELLGFRFDRPPDNPGDALQIALTNLRLVAASLVAACAVRNRPQLRLVLDTTLATVLALNIAAAGIALGAYGGRLLDRVVLHGSLELSAFALGGGGYLSARAGELRTGHLIRAGGMALALVVAGAVIETYARVRAA